MCPAAVAVQARLELLGKACWACFAEVPADVAEAANRPLQIVHCFLSADETQKAAAIRLGACLLCLSIQSCWGHEQCHNDSGFW